MHAARGLSKAMLPATTEECMGRTVINRDVRKHTDNEHSQLEAGGLRVTPPEAD
jgi:hypothetical protein